jgi:putative ABC transport system substrate-binding protein
MRRREFIGLLGGATAIGWPAFLAAQPSAGPRRVGILMGVAEDSTEGRTRIAAFLDGLREAGWIEGANLRLDVRWASGDMSRFRADAADLVAASPVVLVGNGTPAVAALEAATRSIPIVFAQIQDPVGLGFVSSLAHPGGNVTGFTTTVDFGLIGKWVDLLHAVAPSATRVTMLFNPDTVPYYRSYLKTLDAGSFPFAIPLASVEVRSAEEIETALVQLAHEPGGSVLAPLDPFNVVHLRLIAELAAQHRLPSISVYAQFATDGGLLAYGPDIREIFRRAAGYVDRILNGANPADLPIQAPTRFETLVNLKTAAALGLTVPISILAAADEVIE